MEDDEAELLALQAAGLSHRAPTGDSIDDDALLADILGADAGAPGSRRVATATEDDDERLLASILGEAAAKPSVPRPQPAALPALSTTDDEDALVNALLSGEAPILSKKASAVSEGVQRSDTDRPGSSGLASTGLGPATSLGASVVHSDPGVFISVSPPPPAAPPAVSSPPPISPAAPASPSPASPASPGGWLDRIRRPSAAPEQPQQQPPPQQQQTTSWGLNRLAIGRKSLSPGTAEAPAAQASSDVGSPLGWLSGGLGGALRRKSAAPEADGRVSPALVQSLCDGLSLQRERDLLEEVIRELEKDEAAMKRDVASFKVELSDIERVLQEAERFVVGERDLQQGVRRGRERSGTTTRRSGAPQRYEARLRLSFLSGVSDDLSQNRASVGLPVCIAVADAGPAGKRDGRVSLAVGTSRGGVMLFNGAGKRVGVLGEADASGAVPMCTCLDMLPGGDTLVAGFRDGTATVFDTENRQALKTFERVGAHSVVHLGARERCAVLDWDGNVKAYQLRRMVAWFTNTGVISSDQGLLEIAATTVHDRRTMEPVTVLAGASREDVHMWVVRYSATGVSGEQIFRSASSVSEAAVVERSGAAGSHRRRQEESARLARQKAAEHARRVCCPGMSWLHPAEPGSDAQLAVLWHDVVHLYQVRSAGLASSPTVVALPQITLRIGAGAVAFLAPRVLAMVRNTGDVAYLDPQVVKDAPSDPAAALLKTEPVDLPDVIAGPGSGGGKETGEVASTIRQAVKSSHGSLYILSGVLHKKPIRVAKVDMHSFALPIHMSLASRRTASASEGSPASRADQIRPFIDTFIRDWREREAPGRDVWAKQMRRVFTYLADAGLQEMLFSVVRPHCELGGEMGVWISLIEEFAVAGKVRGMADDALEVVCEWLLSGRIVLLHRAFDRAFGKSDPHVTIPFSASCNPDTFCVEVALCASKLPVRETCAVSCEDVGTGWALLVSAAGRWAFRVATRAGPVVVEAGPVLTAGRWTRLQAAVWKGRASLSVDGCPPASQAVSFVKNTSSPLFVGAPPSKGDAWSGGIGMVRVLEGADPWELSDEQLWEHYPADAEVARGPAALTGVLRQTQSLSRECSGFAMIEQADSDDEDAPSGSLQRLQQVLLRLEPAETSRVGGDFTRVLDIAKRWQLHLAVAFGAAKHSSDHDRPMDYLYQRLTAPVAGSFVEWQSPHLAEQRGRVLERDGGSVTVGEWEAVTADGGTSRTGAAAETVPADRVRVVADGDSVDPNAKAGHAMLEYMRKTLAGEGSRDVAGCRKGVLDYVFRHADQVSPDRHGSTVGVEAREYPVLDALLRFDAAGLVSALEQTWFEEAKGSPWRKVVVQGKLVSADDPSTRFALSRDQVVAVLNARLKLTEFKPTEAHLTAARKWPPYDHLVAYLKLLAKSVAREVIDAGRFGGKKGGSTFVKRIFAHLSHACPPDEAERRDRQDCIEQMLETAFRPESGLWTEESRYPDEQRRLRHEVLEPYVTLAERAGFRRTLVFLFKYKQQFQEVLRTYMVGLRADGQGSAGSGDLEVFDFVDETLDSMAQDTAPGAPQRAAEMKKAVLRDLSTFVLADSARTAGLVGRHYPSESLSLLRSLQQLPEVQYAFIKGLIDEEEAGRESAERDQLPGILQSGPVLELYIRHLCRYDPSGAHDFLRAHYGIRQMDLGKVLQIVEKYGDECEKAKIFLLSRNGLGRVADALSRLYDGLIRRMQDLRAHVVSAPEIWDAAADPLPIHAPATTRSVIATPFCRGTPSVAWQCRSLDDLGSARSAGRRDSVGDLEAVGAWPMRRTLPAEALQMHERVAEFIDLGIEISMDSMGASSVSIAQPSGQWGQLLECFLKPKKVLTQLMGESRGWAKVELVLCVAAAVAVAARPRLTVAGGMPGQQSLGMRDPADLPVNELNRQQVFPLIRSSLLPGDRAAYEYLQGMYVEFITGILVKVMAEWRKMPIVGQRVNSAVMRKVLDEGSAFTAGEFRKVLLHVLRITKKDEQMQTGHYRCLRSDAHFLETLHMSYRQKGFCSRPTVSNADRTQTVCEVCKARLSEDLETTVWATGTCAHSACVTRGKRAEAGARGKRSAGEARRAQRKMRNRIEDLCRRTDHSSRVRMHDDQFAVVRPMRRRIADLATCQYPFEPHEAELAADVLDVDGEFAGELPSELFDGLDLGAHATDATRWRGGGERAGRAVPRTLTFKLCPS